MRIKALLTLLVAGSLIATTAGAGTLFVGADVEDFAGGEPPGSGLDRLGVITTDGPNVVDITIIQTDFLLNGIADAGGRLLTGTPGTNVLRYVAFDGTDLGAFTAGIPNEQFNEEMLFVPTDTGATLYHAHFGGSTPGIRQLDPVTGDLIGDLNPRNDIVGMALINGEIWVTEWAARTVNIWDPDTNTLALQFSIGAFGLGNAGALAWDPFDEILWIGTQGGLITPFDLDGSLLSEVEVRPFGPISATIDGLAFLGEVTRVPEPGTSALMILGLIGLAARRRCA